MAESVLSRLLKARFVRAYIGRPFLRVNEWGWNRLPSFVTATRPVRIYGIFLQSLVKLRSQRCQYHGTFFLRNRPELELICRLLTKYPRGSTLRIAVVACSNGAEVYSIVWIIRSARPDLNLIVHAVDISQEIVDIAREGAYPLEMQKLIGSPIFERLTDEEIRMLFHADGNTLRVKPWIKEGIEWHVGDAGDPGLRLDIGLMDIVIANKFLCHMNPPDAEQCLRRIADLVQPGGYLFVSGIDLDIRTKVATELSWAPVLDLLEEIHNGDPSVRRDWPWRYWGLEPFDGNKRNWDVRYASVFQLSN
ncbi:MAG TPA: CheR family methyltransferase [Edaphobacter sp.]